MLASEVDSSLKNSFFIGEVSELPTEINLNLGGIVISPLCALRNIGAPRRATTEGDVSPEFVESDKVSKVGVVSKNEV